MNALHMTLPIMAMIQGCSQGGGSRGARDPPFCKPFLTKQPNNRCQKCHDDIAIVKSLKKPFF